MVIELLQNVEKVNIDDIIKKAEEEGLCQDFVSITLTDEVETGNPKEQLDQYFDHILEIRIDNSRTRNILSFSESNVQNLEPFEAFELFFLEMNGRPMTEEEYKVMETVINKQKEGEA